MLFYVLCLLALGQAALGLTLPQEIANHLCHRSDPNLNTCLMELAELSLEYAKNGIPEWGIDSFDPMKIDFATTESDMEFFKIKMVMRNITFTGQKDVKINKIKFDPKSLTGFVSYSIPWMRMKCDYFATGQLFVIPLESSAHFDGNFTEIDIAVSYHLNTTEKKGKEYFTLEEVSVKSHIGTGHMKLTSINPANQPTVNVIQDFFNENDRLVMDMINPIFNADTGRCIKRVAGSFLKHLPANDIFPY